LTVNQFFMVFAGSLIAPRACLGDSIQFSLNCSGFVGTPVTNVTTSVVSSASELGVFLFTDAPQEELANETTTSYVIDFAQNRTGYDVNSTVANIGQCPATNVVCTVTVPELLNPANLREGLITIANAGFISNFTACSLLLNVFTCPYGDIAVNQQINFPIVFDVSNNGVMNTSITCNATGLVGDSEDELTVYSINIPPPHSSSLLDSSSSSNVIVNVAIPLAVFGGVMFILLCAIALTVVIYLILKKVRAEQDVGF